MLDFKLKAMALGVGLAALTLPVQALANVSVAVTNATGQTIAELWIDGAQLPAYTVERLNGRTIMDGRRREFSIPEDETCYYDLFARDLQGTDYSFRFYQCGSGGVTIE